MGILIIIVAMAIPSFVSSFNKTNDSNISSLLFPKISSIIFIYAGALSLNALYIQSIGSGIGIYSGLFQITVISQLLDIFILIMGSLILIAWPAVNYSAGHAIGRLYSSTSQVINGLTGQYNNKNTKKIEYIAEYSLVVLFSTLGAILLISSADLISMYLSIELQSFGVYILSTLYRNSESATSAGLKYFLLGGLSSCIILLGAGLIYSFTGLTQFESIYSIVSVTDNISISQGLGLGIILVIVGFLFKISAAPLHNWAPDVYDDSPTIVTIWLTIMPKISIIIFLLEIMTGFSLLNSELTLISLISESEIIGSNLPYLTTLTLKNLILISSLLSLIIGTVVGLAQSKIKRLLAYSTISHVGFMLLALAINTEQSTDSLLFYIIQYSITNLNTFLILLALSYIFSKFIPTIVDSRKDQIKELKSTLQEDGIYKSIIDIKYISELKGQFFANPLLSISFTICLFSMAGIPPLIGFFSKQFVLYSAIQGGYYFMAILAILVSIISASYYLKIIKVLLDSKNNITTYHKETNNSGMYNEVNINTTLNTNSSAEFLVYNNNDNLANYNSEYSLSSFHSFMISTLTLSILLFVLKPSILLNITQLLALSLFNF